MNSVVAPDVWLFRSCDGIPAGRHPVTPGWDREVSSVDLWIGVNQCKSSLCV